MSDDQKFYEQVQQSYETSKHWALELFDRVASGWERAFGDFGIVFLTLFLALLVWQFRKPISRRMGKTPEKPE